MQNVMKVTDLELDAEQLDNKCCTYFSWREIPDTFVGRCYISDEQVYCWIAGKQKFHRLTGPALVYLDVRFKHKKVAYVEYWINDKQYSQLEFFDHPLVIENKLKSILALEE